MAAGIIFFSVIGFLLFLAVLYPYIALRMWEKREERLRAWRKEPPDENT